MVVPARDAAPNTRLRHTREARNLTQDEVADGLIQLGAKGVTGGLVSKWERGVCRPNRFHQRLLCRLFGLTAAELGFGRSDAAAAPPEEVIRAALLEPARATVKLSWLVWYGTADHSVVERVTDLLTKLTEVAEGSAGSLRDPALELLAYAHEMTGKVAFDQLDYPAASRHFLEMQQLGEELGDCDILALAAIHQGDVLRRRGQYQLAVQRLESAAPYAMQASRAIEGLRQQTLARAHAEFGYRDAFYQAIDLAERTAAEAPPESEDWGAPFTLMSVLHEKAHGQTLLWEPDKALALYAQTEPAFQAASLRDLGNFTILKAQAHAYAGNVDVGVALGIEGLQFARRYGSPRHVSRVQRMYDRLSRTPIGTSARMRDLAEALRAA